MNVKKLATAQIISKCQIRPPLYKCIILFTLTLMISLVFSSCAFEAEEESAADKCRRERYAELLEKVNQGKTYDLVFAGDSITNLGGFEEEFSDYNCLNLGIGGDRISDLQKRAFMITSVKPKKLFIMIGINSINCEEGNFYTRVANYENLIKGLRASLPNTEIYLESCLPVNQACTTDFSYGSNFEIRMFNIYIEQIAQKYNARYIDLYSLYEENGTLRTTVTIDGVQYVATLEGIHITEKAYSLWYDEIRQYIEN